MLFSTCGMLNEFSHLQAVDAWGTVDILINNAGEWMFSSSQWFVNIKF
jgi:NADP-dependent 3-hydroxy acid dehydrogenase YdfG